ncbi:ribokinase [Metabacillus arenae]|uniref:Ribokinase n=1 Tax=Metabacillus arenae TaxID=2771434 RepID=A0A926S0I9_9BACI|nr:ribokinase [Metabacillus arenae]MBD1383342.1 ribokinase [Metabacillus arenae]
MAANILVVGSLNMDLLIRVNELPKKGETLLGGPITEIPGGKGANQAVAISKMNTSVGILGSIGKDSYGNALLKSLEDHKVGTRYISRSDNKTGTAIVIVDEKGSNQIVVSPGANLDLTPELVFKNKKAIEEADIVVMQLEIPLETVHFTLELAKKMDKITILNPAPAIKLSEDILKNVDILIPNEHELKLLSNNWIEGAFNDPIKASCEELLEKKVKTIIVTLGEKGCFLMNGMDEQTFPAYKVDAVDTTGAGECFIGGFTSTYLKTMDLHDSIQSAIKASAISVTRSGAQNAMPTQKEVETFLC